jgi:penicillin-binding protein 1A
MRPSIPVPVLDLELSTKPEDTTSVCITSVLSSISDRLCAPVVLRSAKKYSEVLKTPSHFLEMLLLIEDKRFAIHFGIDPVAIVRALIFDIRGGVLQGASTIGQQVYSIRQSRSGERSRTLSYKLRQSAWSLFAFASTPKILLLREYLETAYWGRSYFGLDCACKGYFNQDRHRISVAQSFFLAERIAAPNRVSMRRISNLLRRGPIIDALRSGGARIEDVVATYKEIYHCGGEMWELPVK